MSDDKSFLNKTWDSITGFLGDKAGEAKDAIADKTDEIIEKKAEQAGNKMMDKLKSAFTMENGLKYGLPTLLGWMISNKLVGKWIPGGLIGKIAVSAAVGMLVTKVFKNLFNKASGADQSQDLTADATQDLEEKNTRYVIPEEKAKLPPNTYVVTDKDLTVENKTLPKQEDVQNADIVANKRLAQLDKVQNDPNIEMADSYAQKTSLRIPVQEERRIEPEAPAPAA